MTIPEYRPIFSIHVSEAAVFIHFTAKPSKFGIRPRQEKLAIGLPYSMETPCNYVSTTDLTSAERLGKRMKCQCHVTLIYVFHWKLRASDWSIVVSFHLNNLGEGTNRALYVYHTNDKCCYIFDVNVRNIVFLTGHKVFDIFHNS